MKILLVGDINVDILGELPRFPFEGEEVELEDSGVRIGGAAFNTAVVLRRHGLTPVLFASVGEDLFGRSVLCKCREIGISTDFIQLKSSITGMVFSLNTQRDRTMFTIRGANKELSEPEKVYDILKECEMLYISSYAFIEGKQKATAHDILSRAKLLKKFAVLSVSFLSIIKNREGIAEILDAFDLVSMNNLEYMELFGHKNPLQVVYGKKAESGLDYCSNVVLVDRDSVSVVQICYLK